MVDNKETPKTTNPYTRTALVKCFKCNLPGHRSSDYLFRKAVRLIERKEEVICDPEGDREEEEDYEEGDER